MTTDLSFLFGRASSTSVPEDVRAAINGEHSPLGGIPIEPETPAPSTPKANVATPADVPAAAPKIPAATVGTPPPAAAGEALPTGAPVPTPGGSQPGPAAPVAEVHPLPSGAATTPVADPAQDDIDLSFLWGPPQGGEQNLSYLFDRSVEPPTNEPYTGPGYFESLFPQMLADLGIPEDPTVDRNNMVENILKGAAGGIPRILGGLLGLADDLEVWAIGIGKGQPAEDIENRIGRRAADWLKSVGEEQFGYEPNRLTDDPLGEISEGNVFTGLGWAFETGAVSIPDMAAAIATPWAYWASLMDDIVQERQAANEAVGVTATDLAAAALGAGAQAWLERLGAKGVISAGAKKAFKKRVIKGGLRNLAASGGKAAKAGGKAATGEALTEAGQAVAESVAGGVGTERGVDLTLKEIGENALAGFVFGGVVGTGMSAARQRSERKKAEAGEEGSAGSVQDEREAFKRSLRAHESSGDDTAVNPQEDMTATGRYQFIEDTWLRMMKGLKVEGSREELLAMRLDGDMQERAMDLFIDLNTAMAR